MILAFGAIFGKMTFMATLKRSLPKDNIFKDHRIAQVWGITDLDVLSNEVALQGIFEKICSDLELIVVNSFVHKFKPYGISLVFILSQSHLAVHTWPEEGYLHVDIFTCSRNTRLNFLKRTIKKYIQGKRYRAGKVQY